MKSRLLPISSLLLFCLSIGLAGYGQAAQNKWLRKADAFLREKEYAKAIEYYEWAARSDDSYRPLLGLGKTHRALNQYEKAADNFAEAVQKSDPPAEAYYYLGQCLLTQGYQDSAKHWFQVFADKAPDDARAFQADQLEALLGETTADSATFQFEKLRINSKHSDFSAFPHGKDLYFCSARPSQTAVIHTSSADGGALVDLYVVRDYFDSTKNRKTAKPLSPLNTKFHEGPLCISPDGQTIYFTRNDAGRKSDNPYTGSQNPLRIYAAKATEKGWSAPQGLPFNSPDYAVGHPALSPDGKRLYFSSDKPGGKGGADIYSVEVLGDGNFGAVRNLGPEVNTPEDELFPFVSNKGELFFASRGHLGHGGLDIFRSSPERGGWTKAENLGLPVNSPQDDFAYVLDSSLQHGFFSSNRGNAPHNDDLYAFVQAAEEKMPEFQCVPQVENTYCYRFSEVGSMDLFESDDTTAMAYVWDLGDGTKAYGLSIEHCFEGPGDYHIELNLVDTLSGFNFLTEVSSDLSIRDEEQLYISHPEKIYAGSEIELDARKSNLPACSAEDLYWDIEGMDWGKGETYKARFSQPGKYQVRLGMRGQATTGGGDCKSCVTKEIEVLPQKR